MRTQKKQFHSDRVGMNHTKARNHSDPESENAKANTLQKRGLTNTGNRRKISEAGKIWKCNQRFHSMHFTRTTRTNKATMTTMTTRTTRRLLK